MSKVSEITITDNGIYEVCKVSRINNLLKYFITINAFKGTSGTWGSGIMKFLLSTDGGINKTPIDNGNP